MDPQLLREIESLRREVERLRTLEQGKLISASTSFPASPQTGQFVWRTDRSLLYYYDGTRWLSTTEVALPIGLDPVTTHAATALVGAIELRTDESIWITRCSTGYIVNTTNNGSNYWTIAYRGINDAYTTVTGTIHQFDSSAVAAGAWIKNDTAPSGTNSPAGTGRIDVLLTPTGAPGTIQAMATLYYRRVG